MNTILIRKLPINNANAVSAPYVVGFPSITAFMGATHCLERYLKEKYENIKFDGIGVFCHKFNLNVYKGKNDYVHSIIGKGVPIKKDGSKTPFIENARCSMEISLLIKFSGIDCDLCDELRQDIERILISKMKIAGGDIILRKRLDIQIKDLNKDSREIKRKLISGYALIDRTDLVKESVKSKKLDHIDSILDHLLVKHECITMNQENEEEEQKFKWVSYRESSGWVIPICIGYHSISKPDRVKNQRSNEFDHMFTESVLTLGEFKQIYKFENLDDLFWELDKDKTKDNLYVFKTKKTN